MNTLLPTALVAALALSPVSAFAQDVPSYANGGGGGGDQQIRGRITAFDGAYNVQVRDDQGYVDNVELHQGTIINPTGITLAPGMVVSILGYNDGSSFAANEIDTPYNEDAGIPYYGGHPYDYYGPSIGLSFFFGNSGWWHGDDFGGPYHYDRGARVYNDVNVTNIYRNGNFRGRTYVAPEGRGGYYGHGRAYLQNGSSAAVRQNGQSPQFNRGYGDQQGRQYGQPSNQQPANPSYRRPVQAQPQPYAQQQQRAYAPQQQQQQRAYAPQQQQQRPYTQQQRPYAQQQQQQQRPYAQQQQVQRQNAQQHPMQQRQSPQGAQSAPRGDGGGREGQQGHDHH